MKGSIISLFAVCVVIGCRHHIARSQYDITGHWIIKIGQIDGSYDLNELAKPFSNNRLQFLDDYVELSSGFFYGVDDFFNDEFPKGRYPFAYYGNQEKYRIAGDSLYIYRTPFSEWNAYRMEFLNKSNVKLIGKDTSCVLIRSKIKPAKYTLDYVRLKYSGDELFYLEYEVKYTKTDSLFLHNLNPQTDEFEYLRFKLPPGTFQKIVSGFNYVDIFHLDKVYRSEIQHSVTVQLEIGLANGNKIITFLEDQAYPDDLRLALVPLLYYHQNLIYPNLKPMKWY